MSASHPVHNRDELGFTDLDRVLPSGIRDEGQICTLISDELTGSKEFTISWGRAFPGQHHVKHHHTGVAEFYVIIAGNPLIHSGSEDIRAKPGDAFYFPPTTTHGYTNDTDDIIQLVGGVSGVGTWDFIPDE